MALKSSKSKEGSKKSTSNKPAQKAEKPKTSKVTVSKVAASKAKVGKPAAVPALKKKLVKAKTSKASAVSLDPHPPIDEPVIHHDEISLRAYFIAERRHKMGWPGNSGTDWADAVKQLRAEALEKPLKKR